ncbi:GAF domain-containing protein [Microbacterium sp.]|uniref:GAF domain-containing protein n=1 Tax=Microbacterium sp. TaxID=51671 RepID=UPI002812556D|nr:GAF domain-containing protein [Microbacterium sp.]
MAETTTPGWRTGLWTAFTVGVPILGAAASAHFLAVARAVPPVKTPKGTPPLPFWATESFGWYVLAGLCALVAVAVAILGKHKESRRKGALERTNDELTTALRTTRAQLDSADKAQREAVGAAKRAQLVKLRDALMPFASTTADMAQQPLEERPGYLRSVAHVAVSALQAMVAEHADRPRAAVYLLNTDSDPVTMESIGHAGRGEKPRPFEAGTVRGDAALDFLELRRTAFYPNLRRRKPDGYEGTASGYDTFISVPIWTDNGVYGMVSLDAPKAGSLDDSDVALTELTAELMSIPFEVGQDQNTPEPDDTEPTR